jgi:glycosyltransferase involved in cell wall biosynthesis
MNRLPILSVVIPVYNTQMYIEKCLDSLVNQTIDDIEIICINDGSTDNSFAILQRYQDTDKRIKIINQNNEGLSSARNVGIEHAKGKYITFVDSDDFIELNAYENSLSYFDDSTVDLVYFSTRLVIEDHVNRFQDEQYFEHKYVGLVNLSHDVIAKMDVCAWNKIYKLSIIKKYQIRFPDGLWYEDNPFFLSYALVCNSAFFVNDKYYNYLIRNGSIMSQYNKKGKAYYKTLHELDSLLGFEYLLNFVFKWKLEERFKPLLRDLFKQKIYESLRRLPLNKRILALNKATEIVNLFNLNFYFPHDRYLILLSDKCYHKIGKINELFLTNKQRLLGIWDANKYYIICFLGIKIKIKKKKN